MDALTTIDWIVFAAYVGGVFALGAWFSREQHSNEDFFVGGRTMSWIPIGLSMFASIFSSNSFVGLPTEAAYGSFHTYLGILLIPLLVVPITAWLFVPFFHRLGVVSAYEYLELRFHRGLRLFASLLFMLYTFFWMGSLLFATSKVIQPVFEFAPNDTSTTIMLLVGVGLFATAYTAMGGFKAVIWTDVLQAFALGGGMLIILLLAMGRLEGGWAEVWEVGNRHGKFAMFELDVSAKENLYTSIGLSLFTFLPWYACTLTAVQRYVAMPSVAAAKRSLWLNGAMVGVVCLLFFLVGATLFAFYQQHPLPAGYPAMAETTANAAAATELSEEQKKAQNQLKDQLLPRFVKHEIFSTGLLGLMLAGLFAAAMSSMDSGINALTAAVVCDWMPGRNMSVAFSRGLCVLFGLGAIGAAVVVLLQDTPVYQMVINVSGTFMGFLLGLFLLGMLVKRANAVGAAAGLVVAVIGLGFAWGRMDGVWYGAITSLATLCVGTLVSCITAKPAQTQITGLVLGQGAPGELAADARRVPHDLRP